MTRFPDDRLSRFVLAGLLTSLADGLFATVQSVFFYGSTFARLWKGVASVPFGPRAIQGGGDWVAAGLLLHVLVAFTWSAVFVFLVLRWAAVRRVLATPSGVLAVAAVYGPLVWAVMSLVVIPVLVHRPPNVSLRWLYQLIGHFPFVGLPIVWSASRGVKG